MRVVWEGEEGQEGELEKRYLLLPRIWNMVQLAE